MNQQTLQRIYKKYQTEQYFKRYFTNMKQREDTRSFDQIRSTKITIRNNTVVVSRDQTIVICQISTQIQKVIYNSMTKNYGVPLLNIKVNMQSNFSTRSRQNRPSFSIEEFIGSKINWKEIQDQLAYKDSGNKFFAHVGQISLRIVSNDGGLNQISLLAVQLLLWTYKFPKIDIKGEQMVSESEYFMLDLSSFLYGFSCCQILSQLIIDPSLSEQQNCNYMLSIIGDLLDDKMTDRPLIQRKIKKNCQHIEDKIMAQIVKVWKVYMSKLPFNIKQIRRQINDGKINEALDLVIGGSQ